VREYVTNPWPNLEQKQQMSTIPIPPPPPADTTVPVKSTNSAKLASSVRSDIQRFNRQKLNTVDKNIRGEVLVVQKGTPGYGIPDSDDKTEYLDSEDEVVRKVKVLANYVLQSHHMMVYTGAGISTSANIPDYRGPNGLWTLSECGQSSKVARVDMRQVEPTLAHMALKKLCDEKIVKTVVSTNLDGLHVRSGVPLHCLSELHGNMYKAICQTCNVPVWMERYQTKRLVCSSCGENRHFRGSGVAFGHELPQDELTKAKTSAVLCDLALVLGSSMRVSPACNMPESSYKNGGHLVICNLQKTPYDKYASLVIHAKTDDVMTRLMQELSIPIPEFVETLPGSIL
jgi:NAD+-dependent protein deacetylase sirtuin 6